MHAAVFLDRDNTLIHNDGDLGDPAEVRLIQGAASAIASLCGLGYKVVVVTNQGGVARGEYTEDDVKAVHDRLQELVKYASNGVRIDAFYYCPYHPEATVEQYRQEHRTRKPKPGMLEQAAKDLKLDLSQSWMIGDQMRDVQAGRAAGCRTVLLRADAQRIAPEDEVPTVDQNDGADGDDDEPVTPDVVARNLIEAVRVIAQQRKPEVADEGARGAAQSSTQSTAGIAGVKRWDAAAVAQLQKRKPAAKRQASAEAQADPAGEAVEATADAPREEQVKPEPTAPARRAPRPFRPVGAPAPAEEADEEPIVARRRREHRETHSREQGAPPSESPAESSPESPPESPLKTPSQAEPPAPAAATEPAQDEPVMPEPSAEETATTRTLRLILQELRQQRGTNQEEFSFSKLIAIVLQTVAVVCLLGALWMGADDTGLFWRWMGAGLIVQGATIATLLFDR